MCATRRQCPARDDSEVGVAYRGIGDGRKACKPVPGERQMCIWHGCLVVLATADLLAGLVLHQTVTIPVQRLLVTESRGGCWNDRQRVGLVRSDR